MPKRNFNAQQDKIVLGKLIAKLRADKNVSLRRMAQGINIPPSNLTYIEDGRNVPTADVYSRIIQTRFKSKWMTYIRRSECSK